MNALTGSGLELRAAAIRRLHCVPCAECRAKPETPCDPAERRDVALTATVCELRLVAALLADPNAALDRKLRAAAIHERKITR